MAKGRTRGPKKPGLEKNPFYDENQLDRFYYDHDDDEPRFTSSRAHDP